MTLDIHHSSPADIDPLGEGLSARRCCQRASERDKSQRFQDDVFHEYSLDVRQTHKSHPIIFYWARRRKFDANQQFGGSSDVRFGSKADVCRARPHVRYGPIADIFHRMETTFTWLCNKAVRRPDGTSLDGRHWRIALYCGRVWRIRSNRLGGQWSS